MDFKIKTLTRDKEGHYTMIKGSIQEEDITIVNIYAPNIGAPHYIRQMLTAVKWEIDSNTIIVRGLPHPTYNNGQIIQTQKNKEHKLKMIQ